MKLFISINFLSIYFIWGSTYLAILYAIETIPPFLTGFFRFFTASLIILIWKKFKLLPKKSMKIAILSGMLLGGTGNGFVIWAEQYVPSGIAALWIATVPIWVLILNAIFITKKLPQKSSILGALVGFLGILILAWSSQKDSETASVFPTIILCLAALTWSMGTLLSKKDSSTKDIFLFSGYQMLGSAILQITLALVLGEFSSFHFSKISMVSFIGLSYMITFGTVIAYTSYVWLLQYIDAQKVSTYALINPIVALFLGVVVADESFSDLTYLSSFLVLVGVGFILLSSKSKISKDKVL